jgi:ppGpp synthetase/RelA/SpoT-type nucleotidyltranferase
MNSSNPKYFSKKKTDKAGIILCDETSLEEDKNTSLEILSNWRASHSYPMHIFKKRLKNVSNKIDSDALSAQRLKRVPSILKKLDRKYSGNKATMKLTQMQDIAGCRVIMSDVKLVREIYEKYYIKGDLKHTRIKVNNYIIEPKEDGYRGIHLIYKYKSDKGKKDYNGLLVEIQIRSKIQHIWATAVETVDFFTRQAIKSNEGQKDWVEFFKLMSSALAIQEKCPNIPGTPANEKDLFLEIKKIEQIIQVKTKMEKWADSLKLFDNLKKGKTNYKYYLLELDTNLDKLTLRAYNQREETQAIQDYAGAERKIYGKKEYDVVLVGADTIQELKKAYPNYFLDTKEFLLFLEKILNKY